MIAGNSIAVQRQRVLLIDDLPFLREIVADTLAPQGIELLWAGSGADGLRLALSERPHLILLDIRMPDQSGFEICRQLRDDARTTSIPVIFLTAMADPSHKTTGFELGAVDYLVKPFDPGELRARVLAALRAKFERDRLEAQAMQDPLTGLWNRRYFEQIAPAQLALSQRAEEPAGLSLMMIDLDHFKDVNDRLGHPAGDRLLERFAGVLKETVRQSDICCRYGGDEFAVVLPNTSACAAASCAARVVDALHSPHWLEPETASIPVAASIGVAWTGPGHWVEAPQIIDDADRALYRAKDRGRNQVALSPEARSFVSRSLFDESAQGPA